MLKMKIQQKHLHVFRIRILELMCYAFICILISTKIIKLNNVLYLFDAARCIDKKDNKHFK